jgi:hypothetical protein
MNRSLRYEMSEVAARTLQWLTSVLAELADADTTTVLQAYLSLALCRGLAPHLSAEMVPLLQALRITLSLKHSDDLWQCDSDTVLLCCLVQQNLEGQLLPVFAAYAEESTAVFAPAQTSALTIERYEACLLLHRLGYLPAPTLPVSIWPDNLFALLTGEEEQLHAVATQIAVQTDYGACSIEVPIGLPTVLQASALQLLKTYEFRLGCLLLRALVYIGERETLAMRTARAFIIENQEIDGSFGFLAPEITALSAKSIDYNSLNLQLPVTLACLWTLAETNPKPYSLHRHLSR